MTGIHKSGGYLFKFIRIWSECPRATKLLGGNYPWCVILLGGGGGVLGGNFSLEIALGVVVLGSSCPICNFPGV